MGRTLHLTRDPEPPHDSSPTDAAILYQAAVPLRRATLRVLCDAGALELETLAERVANRCNDATDGSLDDVVASLYHNHLQHLSQVRLVVHDEATGVALHSNVDERRVRALLRAGEGDWDALGTILSDDRREHVVTVLEAREEPMAVGDVASAVEAMSDPSVAGQRESAESTHVSLHHVDLPKLEAAGVVEYDHEADHVEIRSVPDAYREVVDGTSVPMP